MKKTPRAPQIDALVDVTGTNGNCIFPWGVTAKQKKIANAFLLCNNVRDVWDGGGVGLHVGHG